jgi:hypothetical protein
VVKAVQGEHEAVGPRARAGAREGVKRKSAPKYSDVPADHALQDFEILQWLPLYASDDPRLVISIGNEGRSVVTLKL